MIYDHVRNDAYARALEAVITPDSVVLDLGAGLGVHGLVAARLGARKVYMVDPSPAIRVVEKIAADNGLSGCVQCIEEPIENVSLPEKVDVIVSVMTGNFLLSENLLASLFYARDQFLAPGGVLLPERAQMYVAAVSVPGLYDKFIASWAETSQGLDFSSLLDFAANNIFPVQCKKKSVRCLSEPVQLTELDFLTAKRAGCDTTIELSCSGAGRCEGLLGWFDMQLGQQVLSTSPLALRTHWSQIYLPFEPPLEVTPGDVIGVRIIRPPQGEWTWEYNFNGRKVRRSTFNSSPIDTNRIESK